MLHHELAAEGRAPDFQISVASAITYAGGATEILWGSV